MAAKKIKLEGEAISEILVADTTSELGVEASDVNRLVWRRRRRRKKNKKEEKNEEGWGGGGEKGGGRGEGGGGKEEQQASAEVTITKHWPANLLVMPSVFFSQPKKGHTVCQM